MIDKVAISGASLLNSDWKHAMIQSNVKVILSEGQLEHVHQASLEDAFTMLIQARADWVKTERVSHAAKYGEKSERLSHSQDTHRNIARSLCWAFLQEHCTKYFEVTNSLWGRSLTFRSTLRRSRLHHW